MLNSISSPEKYIVGLCLLMSGIMLTVNLSFNLGYNTFSWLFFGFSWIIFSFYQYRAQKK